MMLVKLLDLVYKELLFRIMVDDKLDTCQSTIDALPDIMAAIRTKIIKSMFMLMVVYDEEQIF